MEMQLKDVFSKYKFSGSNGLSRLEIVILHRGAPNNRKTISGKDIRVYRTYFEYFDGFEWIYIPFHRILEIREGNKVIWRKRERSKV